MAFKAWNNTAGGNWSVASNWALNSPPGNNDGVTFAAGTYTSVLDPGFAAGIVLTQDIVLQPNVTLDIQKSIAVEDVIGSSQQNDGLLKIGNGATLTITNQDQGGQFVNQTLFVMSDGVGAAGQVSFNTLGPSGVVTMDGGRFDAKAIVSPLAVVNLLNGAAYNAVVGDAFNDGIIALTGGIANLANISDLTNITGDPLDQVVSLTGPAQDEVLLPNTLLGKGLTVTGYGFSDLIGIAGITTVKSATYDASHHLNFFASTNGTGTPLAQLTGVTLAANVPATLGTTNFTIVTNTAGTFVELIACFAEGTRIATERGMVAVEALCEGDKVRTALGGKLQPIVWLGHRRIDCRRHRDPVQVWPVRIVAGAFGPGRPYRDLVLSPDHSLFINGALIPVQYLVNGRTIFQEVRDEVTYWHVELPGHNVLYAEGVPAESYLDTGNRSAFANGGALVDVDPDFSRRVWEADCCAELVMHGPRLSAAKQRLLVRASALGHRVTLEPDLSVLAHGRKVKAVRDGLVWCVRLPEAMEDVRLVSRCWVPAHLHADASDMRQLGIAIAHLRMDGHDVALDGPAFGSGWHEPEGGWRWTDGDAELVPNGAREVSFELTMTGTYWQEEARDAAVRAA